MNPVLYAFLAIAWIILRLTLVHRLLLLAFGVTLRRTGSGARLGRYGLEFSKSVYWAEPVSSLGARVVNVVRGHIVVQFVVVFLTGVLAMFLTDALFGLALLEFIWLVANLYATLSIRTDLEAWKSHPTELTLDRVIGVLELEAAVHRPSAWPRDALEALDMRAQGPGDMLPAYYLYAWANDIGDVEARRAAVERMEAATLETIYPRKADRYEAWSRMVRDVLAFEYASNGELERSSRVLEGGTETGNWGLVAGAIHDIHGGRTDCARSRLDEVWRSIASTEELQAYVLEQSHKVDAGWVPPAG